MEVCSQNLNDPFTVLLKVNGNKCDMKCKYCSELPKDFSEEQCTYDYNKLDAMLMKLPRDVDIILHGGEPSLIGMENIFKLINRISELGFLLKPSIQTNGYLGDKWVEFFSQNKDLLKVSVSIDGNQECNIFRRTSNLDSNKAFHTIDSFLHKLDENEIEFRCIATINSVSWDKGKDIINYFSQFKYLRFVRLNPCFDIDEEGIKEWAITPNQYLECLKQSFNTMLELETYKTFKLDPIMDMMDNLRRKTAQFEFKCNKFSSIFPNGVVTSCDAMREVEQNVEISKDMFEHFIQPEYSNWVIEKCSMCENLSICKGGCPPLMQRYNLYDKNLLEEYCHYRVAIRKYIQGFLQ